MAACCEKNAMTLHFEGRQEADRANGIVVRMVFEEGLETVTIEGESQQPGVHNFFIGNDPSKWRSEVPSYARVVYRDIYEGVDLRVREENGWLEYDMLLTECADLNQIAIRCDGVKELKIERDGSLVMETEIGSIRQRLPTTWYELPSGERQPVECRYRQIDSHRYGFEVSERNLDLALVIDPGLEWSTFLGGTDGGDVGDGVMGLALNASGDIVMTGYTDSPDFPTTPGVYDTTLSGNDDVFVACLDADGSQLLWSTYLGGSYDDWIYDLTLEEAGPITIAGLTFSSDFPTTASAFDTTHNGDCDAMVARLTADGTQLIYSTYLGDSGEEWAMGLSVDGLGEAIVGGYTESSDFPTTPGAHDTTYNGGVRDAFVTRLNADGTDLIYSTFLGGNGEEGYQDWTYPENMAYMDIALHGSGDVIVGGITRSSNFPTTPQAYDTTHNGSYDAFVVRLDATGSNLVYSTFLGGYDGEGALAVAVDEFGETTIGGYTWSPDFPTTAGAYDIILNGDNDAFVARLDATGSNLVYSTFIGGMSPDGVYDLTLDGSGNVIITGWCRSRDFPTTPGAYDTTYNRSLDGYLSRINLGGNGADDLLYSSFIGGFLEELGMKLALVDDSTAILGSVTGSPDFPTTPGAYDRTHDGTWDGFVCRFGMYAGPVLSVFGYEWIDSGGDEHADPSDTIDLTVTLLNCFKDASTVTASISSNDPCITLIDSSSDYGEILCDSIQDNSHDPFVFWVDGSAQLHRCTLNVDMWADGDYFCETISIIIDTPSVLVVDDDGGDTYETYFIESLERIGVLCDQKDQEDGVTSSFMSDYETLIWLTGDNPSPIDSADALTLADYLDSGGNLFISGQDVEGCADTSFYHNYLHASLRQDSTEPFIVNGVDGDLIGDGLRFYIVGVPGAFNQVAPSIISPIGAADSIFDYQLGGCCGVRYDDSYKVVYLSFGFEAISQLSQADSVMRRILDWYGVGIEEEVVQQDPSAKSHYLKVHPNPFKGQLQIEYFVPSASMLELQIYDGGGRMVRELLTESKLPGIHRTKWDGRDSEGKRLANGVYFCRMAIRSIGSCGPVGKAGEFTSTKKMILLR
jgi:hypothetical protein